MIKDNTLNEKSLREFTSCLELKCLDSKKINAIYNAIKPETTVLITQRGKTEMLKKNEHTLIMNFYAADFISLRAILGSYLRWLEVIFNSLTDLD